MSVAPVTVAVSGVTKDASHKDNILVGQGATGTLSSGGLQPTSYSWSVGGDKFASWVVSSDQSTGTLNYVPASEWSQPSPHWYWSNDQNANTVSCLASVSYNGFSLGSVSAHRDVDVWPPPYSFTGEPTQKSSYDSNGLTSVNEVLAYDRVSSHPGMLFTGGAITPALFSASGAAAWQLVQIAAPYRSYTDDKNTTHYPFVPGNVGLDNFWPYPGYANDPPWGAPVDSTGFITLHSTSDSPSQGSASTDLAYEVGDSYKMSMMFHPGGSDAQWVSISSKRWGWSGAEHRNNSSASWSSPPLCTIISDNVTHDTLQPTWSRKLSNVGG